MARPLPRMWCPRNIVDAKGNRRWSRESRQSGILNVRHGVAARQLVSRFLRFLYPAFSPAKPRVFVKQGPRQQAWKCAVSHIVDEACASTRRNHFDGLSIKYRPVPHGYGSPHGGRWRLYPKCSAPPHCGIIQFSLASCSIDKPLLAPVGWRVVAAKRSSWRLLGVPSHSPGLHSGYGGADVVRSKGRPVGDHGVDVQW